MRVALIGVADPLAHQLRVALGARNDVVTLSDAISASDDPTVASCDVVVHSLPGDDSPAAVDESTRGTWKLLNATGARRLVQLSSMRMFDGYPDGWSIDEDWVPRPTPEPEALVPYLGELASREISRRHVIECVALRLDRVTPAEVFEAGPVGSDWIHVADAATAIAAVIEAEVLPGPAARWRALHIVRGDGRYPLSTATATALSFTPAHPFRTPYRSTQRPEFPARPQPLDALPAVDRVTIFGAGGPLAAVTGRELSTRHALLLTDNRPLSQSPRQSPGAPLPDPVVAPNVERLVDITDPAQVADAAAGADCLINCAVIRTDVDLAFRVNVIGALNVMQAAVAHDIGRVVFTGPALTLESHPVGYNEDREISSSAPPRPGDNLYHLTKFLAQEICRVYAEHYRIGCPALLYCGFVSLDVPTYRAHPFSVTWADAGRAMAAAVEVDRLPEPFPILHIHADSPHGRYRNDAARAVLGWQPQDRVDHCWFRTS